MSRLSGINVGETFILEHPIPGEVYYMGTDPIPMGDKKEIKEGSSDRSYHISLVLKGGEKPMPVAYYKVRTNDSWVLYNEVFKLQQYYNDCQNMVEKNASSVLFTRYTDAGTYSKYLANFPYAALIPGWEKQRLQKDKIAQKGWDKGTFTMKPAYDCLAEYIVNYWQDIWILELINDIEDYGLKKGDMTDAFICAVIFYYHKKRVSTSKQNREVQKFSTTYYAYDSMGRMVLKTANLTSSSARGGHEGFWDINR